MVKKQFLTYCLFVFFLQWIHAQDLVNDPPAYIFTSYSAADGLASPEIISIATDNKGYLWLGTSSGISRYDGHTFTNFGYAADNSYIGEVRVIKPGTGDKLWIGSTSGLFCYTQNRIVNISAAADAATGVNDIVAENNGSLWLATESGPAFLAAADINMEGGKTVLRRFLLPQWKEMNAAPCLFIKKAADGTVYFAQQYKLYRYGKKGIQDLYTASAANDKMEYVFAKDSTTVFWNASVTGLHKMKNDLHTTYRFAAIYQPQRKPVTEGYWYTGSLGLVCFHPGEEFISASVSFHEEGAQWLSGVLEMNNLLWLATHSGLIRIKKSPFSTFKHSRYNELQESFSLCQLNTGELLVGGNHGKLYSLSGTTVKKFLPGQQSVPHAEIKALHSDAKGWLWIGSGYEGLGLYRNGKATWFTKEQYRIHDNSFASFLQTRTGQLYAVGDMGLTKITPAATGDIIFTPFCIARKKTPFAKFYGGIEAPDGTIWIGGEEGLWYLQKDTLLYFQLTNKNIQVRSIKVAADASVWVATTVDGIFECRFTTAGKLQVIKQYTEKDGLNTLQYLDLLVDRTGNVWAGSVKGITLLAKNGAAEKRIINFIHTDGFIKPGYYSIKLYQDKTGMIWAGTSSGITSFNPSAIFDAAVPPEIYLTGVYSLKNEKKALYGEAAPGATKPVLSYSNNSLTFNYTSIDYANTEGMRYYYRMEGFDSNWINTGASRSVTCYSLPPGSYTFSVKAVNAKGLWTAYPAEFSFVIKRPFWQTWWFWIACLLSAGILLYRFSKWREKQIAAREAQKTEVEKIKAASYQYQLEVEKIISFFATTISSHSSENEMLWHLSENLIGQLGFEECMIYLWNGDQSMLIQRAGHGLKGDMKVEENKNAYHIPRGKGIVGAVAESGKTELVQDTSKDKRYFSADQKIMFSELCVPMMLDKKVIGVINTEHSKKNFFTAGHSAILTTIAALCADRLDKLKTYEERRIREMEVLVLNKDLAASQLNALRAQMNPHFIFNAMNSIQQFTLRNDTDNANLYISKFSMLLRKTLHTSPQGTVTLEEELEQLDLYLSIEKLRMDSSFSYTVTVDAMIEPDAVKIPAMMIQPFVENALKHGLLMKEGDKRLVLAFSLAGENELLATITDNGIGREKAGLLKQQHEKLLPYESKGIELVKERLQLLYGNAVNSTVICFTDLADEAGNSAGTTVSIRLPLT